MPAENQPRPDVEKDTDGVTTISVPQDLEDAPASLQEAVDQDRGGGEPYPGLSDSAGMEDGVAGTGGVNKTQEREI